MVLEILCRQAWTEVDKGIKINQDLSQDSVLKYLHKTKVVIFTKVFFKSVKKTLKSRQTHTLDLH